MAECLLHMLMSLSSFRSLAKRKRKMGIVREVNSWEMVHTFNPTNQTKPPQTLTNPRKFSQKKKNCRLIIQRNQSLLMTE